jgi:hypothetical protein
MTFVGVVWRGDDWPMVTVVRCVNTDDGLPSRAQHRAPARRHHRKEASA